MSMRYLVSRLLIIGLLGGLFNVASAAEGNHSKLVLQLIPDQVPAGKEFSALIQLKNTGSTTWSSANGFYLSSIKPQPWELYRVELDKGVRVAPGDSVTIKPTIMAPLIPGEYQLQLQMGQGSKRFGERSELVTVHVTGSMIPLSFSEFVYQDVPEVMKAGGTYKVTVQYKNIGDTVWTPGQYQLQSTEDKDLTWAVDAVDIKRNVVVPPDSFQAFSFDVKAPSEPGTYDFQWQMSHKQMGAFGPQTPKLSITVE